jgi:hypothetical protein
VLFANFRDFAQEPRSAKKLINRFLIQYRIFKYPRKLPPVPRDLETRPKLGYPLEQCKNHVFQHTGEISLPIKFDRQNFDQ